MTDADAPETVLVTGGTGYLAAWVIVRLLEQGYRVRPTVRSLGKADQVRRAVGEQVGEDAAAALEFAAADLLADDGWDEATAGVGYVLHTASPLGFHPGEDLIRTAREGVARVLGAAARAGVKRAVLTSSGVAAVSGEPGEPASEAIWATAAGTPLRMYNDSKILAEQDAWDFAARAGLELVTVLPTFMQGPMLGPSSREGSVEVIRRLLAGGLPAIPNIGWDVVDVRDIADLHLRAMTDPAAADQRLLGSGAFLWWRDMARILREQLPGRGYSDLAKQVPTRTMPDLVVKLLSRINPQLAMVRPDLGRKTLVDSSKARALLDWRPRPVEQTVVDTATALIAEHAVGT